MKKFIRLSTLFLALLLLAGCSGSGNQDISKVEETLPIQYEITSESGYRYVRNGEEAYVSLPVHYENTSDNDNMGQIEAPHVVFSSVDEMKKDIKYGIFTEEELKHIAQFPRNSDGTIKAPNVDTLDVSLPDCVKLYRITWSGGQPSFDFVTENGNADGGISFWSQESLSKNLETNYINQASDERNEKTEIISKANGKISGTAYYFTPQPKFEPNRKLKYVQYQVSEKDITYYVQEQYELTDSDEQLNFIFIWGFGTNTAFMAVLADLVTMNLPQLSIDEITAFRLTS